VIGVLEVSGRDDDRVDVLHRVELVGVASLGQLLAGNRHLELVRLLSDVIGPFVAAFVPDVADRNGLEIQPDSKPEKTWNQRIA
jgi:hypothetical protein